MRSIELTCAAIVALYAYLRLRAPGVKRVAVVARLLALSCAAWVGEDSVIRGYGFYSYTPGWSFFLDRVPLLIVAIWPVVIDSAHLLARHLTSGTARIAAASGLIVLADASLIEPIAVHARLWTWSAENPRRSSRYRSWGSSDGLCSRRRRSRSWKRSTRVALRPLWDALAIAAAPLFTHAALLMAWWGALRYVGGGWAAWVPVAAAWCALTPVAAGAWRRGGVVPLGAVFARAPGAAFFFALLALTARDRGDLVAFAIAFAPPYVALIARRARGPVATARIAASPQAARMPDRGMRTG